MSTTEAVHGTRTGRWRGDRANLRVPVRTRSHALLRREVFGRSTKRARADVFVISRLPPVNDTLMEAAHHVDAFKRASATDHGRPALLRLRAPGPQGAGRMRSQPSSWPTSWRRPAWTASRAGLHAGQIRVSSMSRWTTCSRPGGDDRFRRRRTSATPSRLPDAGGVERARAIAKRSTRAWPSSTSGATSRRRRRHEPHR